MNKRSLNVITIRQAETSDAEKIKSFLGQLGYADFEVPDVSAKIISHQAPGYQILVAEVEAQVVGFISLHWFDLVHWKGKLGRITSFCVDQNFRSKGVGHQLLSAGEAVFRREGCAKFEVTSNLKRTRAHEFYLREGYLEDSKRFVKYPNQFPDIYSPT